MAPIERDTVRLAGIRSCTAAICVVCALVWGALWWSRENAQQQARKMVEQCGGIVLDGEFDPTYVQRLLGCVTPRTATSASEMSRAFGDEQLAKLTAIKTLSILDLTGSGVMSKGLERLRRFPLLFILELDATDDDLLVVSNTSAAWLTLVGKEVTDKGILHLQRMPNLEFVSLVNTSVTQEGARALEELRPDVSVTLEEP